MRDQADELRQLVRREATAVPTEERPELIVVCGGKGGVGTTTTAVNLAVLLTRYGKRALLVDADLSHADGTKLCGLDATDSIADVLAMQKKVLDVVQRGPGHIQVLPGTWGASRIVDCSPAAQTHLIQELEQLKPHADVIVLDAGSGLSQVMKRFWQVATRVVLVSTGDSAAVMDAYAAIKVLCPRERSVPIHLIASMLDADIGEDVFLRISRSCHRFLGFEPTYLGHVQSDLEVAESTENRRIYVLEKPFCRAARDAHALVQRLMNINRDQSLKHFGGPYSTAAVA